MSVPPVTTREEAIQRALDTAEGRLSRYHNLMLEMEADPAQRGETLLLIAQADLADVQMWAALAAVLP